MQAVQSLPSTSTRIVAGFDDAALTSSRWAEQVEAVRNIADAAEILDPAEMVGCLEWIPRPCPDRIPYRPDTSTPRTRFANGPGAMI